MMEKDEEKLLSRRRMEKWIKIFLAFLAFVWLCTIISKSIYVSGLPRVRTDTASKKYVEHVVRTDGIVTAGGEIAVNTQAGLRVDKIFVQQGDEVQAGDVLFTIDTADLAELVSAKETELSKLECNLSDWQVNAVIDAQQKEVAILWAKEDYETADKETAVAKERAKEALEKAEAALGRHLADTVPYTADNARREAWDAYHDWVNKGYSISDKIAAKEREIQDLELQILYLALLRRNLIRDAVALVHPVMIRIPCLAPGIVRRVGHGIREVSSERRLRLFQRFLCALLRYCCLLVCRLIVFLCPENCHFLLLRINHCIDLPVREITLKFGQLCLLCADQLRQICGVNRKKDIPRLNFVTLLDKYLIHPQPRLCIDSNFTACRHDSIRPDNMLHILF